MVTYSAADFILGAEVEKAVLQGREELGTGVSAMGAVSIVDITGFGNWTPGS